MLKCLSSFFILMFLSWHHISLAESSSQIFFDVKLTLDKFNEHQQKKIQKAAELIKKIVVSEKFRDAVIHYTWKGERSFADNNGLSNEEIYQKIIDGSEDLRPGVDKKMDLDLEVYFEDTRTVGYTKPDVFKIWMNSKYLDKNGPAEVTTNMMHEWLHKLGFNHEIQHSEKRMNTVPYAIGYIVEKFAKKLESDGTL
jgi:hypothetical protein